MARPKSNKKTGVIRVDIELKKFLESLLENEHDTLDNVIKRLLPNPLSRIKYAVNSVLFDDIDSARVFAEGKLKPIHLVQMLENP